MKKKILNIERSPFNRVYFLELECGHTVTRKRMPIGNTTDCEDCKMKDRHAKKNKEGVVNGQSSTLMVCHDIIEEREHILQQPLYVRKANCLRQLRFEWIGGRLNEVL